MNNFTCVYECRMNGTQQIAKNAYLVQPKTKQVSHHVLIVNLGDS